MESALISTTEEAAAIQAGRIAFHAAAFSSCLSYLGTIDCESGTGGPNPCNGALVGLRNEQQGCYIDGECAPGLYCAGTVPGRCGLCERRVAAGGPCPATNACADGTTCDATSHMCVENDVQEGHACNANLRCSGFLECVTGTCTRLAELNQSCDRMAMTLPNCNFLEGLVCYGPGSTCIQITFSPPGATCGGTVACSLNSEGCDMTTHMCTRLPSAGQPCDASLRCDDSATCDLANRTCTAKKPSDEPCVGFGECASPLVCTLTTTTSTRGVCKTPGYMLCP
jgi:hypothetical protein